MVKQRTIRIHYLDSSHRKQVTPVMTVADSVAFYQEVRVKGYIVVKVETVGR